MTFRAKIHHASKTVTAEHDVLLVLGDGDCMRDDLANFMQFYEPHDVAALGRCIKEYPGKVLHWMNADGPSAVHWAKNLINGNGTIRHTLGECDGFDVDWDMEQPDYNFEEITHQKGRIHGSSAMFATLAGLEMGYSKIVLAGCPMDHNGHWYFGEKNADTLGPIWLGADVMAWLDFKEAPESEKVRSMSGYTAKILGSPTKGWLCR